jgi:protein gp37
MQNSKIEWTDHTFNPWIGCTKVSPGCAHCYAEVSTRARVLRAQGIETWGKGGQRQRTQTWKDPIRWNQKPWVCERCGEAVSDREEHNKKFGCTHGEYHRARVFCASLADWLDNEVPVQWLADLLKLIHDTPNLDWLLLTKRPENWTRIIGASWTGLHVSGSGSPEFANWLGTWFHGGAPANVWVGTTVENQAMADERIPQLTSIPARIRFLSCEPLLESVDLGMGAYSCVVKNSRSLNLRKVIDWVIVGGESGKDARPFNVAWARDIVKQCKAAGVAAFVKQLGKQPLHERWPKAERDFSNYGRVETLKLKDNKGGDINEFPADLRVREFPKVD